MHKSLYALVFLYLCVFSPAAAEEKSAAVHVSPDHADYFYSVGDSAVFSITLKYEGPASSTRLHYRFSEDNTRFMEDITLERPSKEIILKHGLEHPGFLRLDLSLFSGADTVQVSTAVGFSVDEIRPTNNLPGDWRSFWQQGLGEVYRVPMDPQVSLWKEQESGVKRYLVSLANIEGSRIYGWMTIPDGPGPFPALVYIQGAPGGIEEYQTDPQTNYARRGMIVLAINPHGIELGREESFYRLLMSRHIPGDGASLGVDDPYRYYFRRVVLGAIRSFDYLCSREDVDTARLAVAGASQGGGLSLLTAAVDHRVMAVTVHVPAMCDFTGVLHERPAGWPWLLGRRSSSGKDERVVRTCAYFDAALAASQIRVPAFFTVSFLDQSCPPTTVYSAFNSLRGPREIKYFPDTTHPESFTGANDSLMVDKLEALFREMKNK
ncbi:acetylxylan esterase [bacterium]|nr:acetylxylan esterase [bacterium]